MKVRIINPSSLIAPSGYSHGLLAEEGRKVLFLGGQVGWDRDGKLARGVGDGGGGDFTAQFARALDNLLEVLREAGGRPGNLTQLRIYVVDKSEYLAVRPLLGEVWKARMGRHYPAISLVAVADLLEEGARVEIEGMAVL